jgi:hypothetical protein
VNPRTAHLATATSLLALVSVAAFGTSPAAAATPASAAAPIPAAGPAASAAQPLEQVLSNESTSTTWANGVEEAAIHLHPDRSSRTIARTHLLTEDGFPEVYLLLATRLDAHGELWVRMRIPGRPNGLIGWVPAADLSQFHVTHWHVVISLGGRSLKAYYDGHLRFSAPVGVGKPSTPTPTGRFWIREIFKVPSPASGYFPWAIGTSAYSRLTDWPGGGVVGIHGDFGEPQAIPGDPSHGCVRMRDGDIARLAPRLQVGTPVTITR